MGLHPLAGRPPIPEVLVDVPRLITAYYTEKPDVNVSSKRVSFGTSGHRGSSFHIAFNEDHILSIAKAICDYRRDNRVDGPLFALSTRPNLDTACRIPMGVGASRI
jgi:phosphoglucomutase